MENYVNDCCAGVSTSTLCFNKEDGMKPKKSKFVTALVISNEICTQCSYNPSELYNPLLACYSLSSATAHCAIA